MKGNSSSTVLLRPISLLILLAFAALLVPIALVSYWYSEAKNVEHQLSSNSEVFLSDLQSEIEQKAKLFNPLTSSSSSLARYIVSSLNVTNFSFDEINTKVAPVLFQAILTVPYLTEISFIESNGPFFSYFKDGDQALAMYSNSSLPSYYIHLVDSDTGRLYGEAIKVNPSINKSLFQITLNSSNGYVSLGKKWNNDSELLFLSSSIINNKGSLISLGFPASSLLEDYFKSSLISSTQGGFLFLATKDGKVLLQGLQNIHVVVGNEMVSLQYGHHMVNISCKNELVGVLVRASILDVQDTKYLSYCSQVDIMGVESVYVLAFPQGGLAAIAEHNSKVGLVLLAVILATVMISIFSFLFTTVRAYRREMHMCASLIKQIDATEQAERKSMNKSLAFAKASHDIRASLAGIRGLIEISHDEVSPVSELETNLNQMDVCAKDLLGLLNSILDTSKIEAGKMQLEEEEFNLSQLLEDVVDLYHPVAMKKGVDVVLDPHDGSVIRYSSVKGDRGKLKQVFCNLLSNAVKFTDEGHIRVRAWMQKPRLKKSIMDSRHNTFMKNLSCLFYKKTEARSDIEAMESAEGDPNAMDFVFEVDDTGKGIPKEKQKSVFENYVQVKETALGQGGTGLGLGIVQSLVRLMHGDIGIVEKEFGERGTCFRFNVLLSVCESSPNDNTREGNDSGSDISHPLGLMSIHTQTLGSGRYSPSPRLTMCTSSPKPEPSHVVLLIQNEERLRISQKFMERLGIKVSVVRHWERLSSLLNKIKHKQIHSHQSSSGKLEDISVLSSSSSGNSSARRKDAPSSATDGVDHIPLIFKKTNSGTLPGFILIVVDANAGPFEVLFRTIAQFRRGLNYTCRVVWLEKPLMRNINPREPDHQMFDVNDIVISKPFHGTRLYEVTRLLPEYGGTMQRYPAKIQRESEHQLGESNRVGSQLNRGELQDPKICEDPSHGDQKERNPSVQGCRIRRGEIEEHDGSSGEKPLNGKKFLLVEDHVVLRKVTKRSVSDLGASVEVCENGEEAVQLVSNGFCDQMKEGSPITPPYDYILMDCEMPVMNGFEATMKIREIERSFGVRMPIIALTAHTSGAETIKTIEAGMDVHLCKPLERERLVEAVRHIDSV